MKRQILTLVALSGTALATQTMGQAAVIRAMQAVSTAGIAQTGSAAVKDVMVQGATRAGRMHARSVAKNTDYSGKVKLKQ